MNQSMRNSSWAMTLLAALILPGTLHAEEATDPEPAPAPASSTAAGETAAGETAAGETTATPTPARGTLTLAEAQRLALERNPSVRSLAQEIDRASALLRQAWAAVYPNLGMNLTYTMADQPTVVSFDTGAAAAFGPAAEIVVRQQHVATLGLSARQPIINAPAFSGIRMAYLSRDLSDLTVEQARRQLALGVAQAFYAVITTRRTNELIDRHIALAQEDVTAARARLEAQAGLAIDVARAELQVEQRRSQRETTRLAFENTRDALALLLGIPPDDLPALREPEPADATSVDELDELVDRARSERLDLRAAQRQIRLAELGINRTWLSFAPTLDLNWSLSYTLSDLGGFGDRRTSWNLIVLLNFPLFDGGYRYGQLRSSRAQLRQAQLAQEALEQSVAIQVRQAYRGWQTSLTTLEISRRQLELATEAHRLARASYAAGAASNLEVVEAQRQLIAAEVDVELQRLNTQISLIELISRLEVGPSNAGGASSSSGAQSSGGSGMDGSAASSMGGGSSAAGMSGM